MLGHHTDAPEITSDLVVSEKANIGRCTHWSCPSSATGREESAYSEGDGDGIGMINDQKNVIKNKNNIIIINININIGVSQMRDIVRSTMAPNFA